MFQREEDALEKKNGFDVTAIEGRWETTVPKMASKAMAAPSEPKEAAGRA